MNETIHKTSWLELFYDLVFVVAIAKAVQTLGHAHHGQIELDTYFKYVLIMIPLWWAWTGHTLFANRFDTDDVFQRLMTLAQMVAAASLAVFIDPDFDPNYHGFLLSYAVIRGLLVLMYGRAAMLADGASKDVVQFLGLGLTVGLLISLSSLLFEGPWKYVVLYLGIGVDIMIPLFGRRYLARAPVDSHHMPERYARLTLILLGSSVANLVAAFESVSASVQTVMAALAGFILIAAIWWIYYDSLETRIYGRALGTGQAVTYLHLAILVGLGGIATMIRFAVDPVLALADYRLLVGLSTAIFLIALQLLLQLYHPKAERGPLRRNAVITVVLAVGALALAPTNVTMLWAMSGIFAIHAVIDAKRQQALERVAKLDLDEVDRFVCPRVLQEGTGGRSGVADENGSIGIDLPFGHGRRIESDDTFVYSY